MVDPWQRKTILEADLIEIGEVDADSPLAILLLHQDWIGEPLRIMSLPGEVGSKQSVNFLAEDLTSLRVHLSQLLIKRTHPGCYIENSQIAPSHLH